MFESKYYITVNNKTVAENVTLEYVRVFVTAIFDTFYNDHDIAEMPKIE